MCGVIPSIVPLLQELCSVFTQPSAVTFQEVFQGWVLCLGRRTEFRVFEAIGGKQVSRQRRHPFDRYYNFFSRSAWTVRDLAHAVAVRIVVALNRSGELVLVVDSTLLHKSGRHVFAIGWFHDPVRSTKKRVATALGNQWTVLGLAILQSLIRLWYVTEGCKLPEARAARRQLGPWDSEWSLRHMVRVLCRATIRAAISATSTTKHDLHQLVDHLENYLFLAA
jgi:DDE superfamily endonuclease